jgi:steroid delta-isomerase-like uncharacterized protein
MANHGENSRESQQKEEAMKSTSLPFLGLVALLIAAASLPAVARSHKGGSTEANKALAHRVTDEVWNQGNTAAIDELFTATAVTHGRTAAEDIQGADGFKQYVTRLRTAFPDLHLTVEDQIAERDKVANRFTMHGTQKGDLQMGPDSAIPPTGKEVTITGIVINRMENGKIAETWVNVDQLALLQQLGLFPPAPARATSP